MSARFVQVASALVGSIALQQLQGDARDTPAVISRSAAATSSVDRNSFNTHTLGAYLKEVNNGSDTTALNSLVQEIQLKSCGDDKPLVDARDWQPNTAYGTPAEEDGEDTPAITKCRKADGEDTPAGKCSRANPTKKRAKEDDVDTSVESSRKPQTKKSGKARGGGTRAVERSRANPTNAGLHTITECPGGVSTSAPQYRRPNPTTKSPKGNDVSSLRPKPTTNSPKGNGVSSLRRTPLVKSLRNPTNAAVHLISTDSSKKAFLFSLGLASVCKGQNITRRGYGKSSYGKSSYGNKLYR